MSPKRALDQRPVFGKPVVLVISEATKTAGDGHGLSDVELLGRIQAGDHRAVGALYDRYASMLFPLSLRIVRDRGEAEDILHDAFVTVAERAGQYVPERGAVVAWLVTLVRNLSIDRTRRRDRRGAIARDVLAHDPVVVVTSPEELTSDAAERHSIRTALATLPEAQQKTLVLAFFEGKSYPEIAEEEGVPLGTIKSRAARALAALRAALEAAGVNLAEALSSQGPQKGGGARGTT